MYIKYKDTEENNIKYNTDTIGFLAVITNIPNEIEIIGIMIKNIAGYPLVKVSFIIVISIYIYVYVQTLYFIFTFIFMFNTQIKYINF